MPGSPYTGSASATQAPGPTPAAGTPPIGQLPNDGDAANAASIAQALKEPLDFATFEQAPFANPSAWTQAIRAVRNAKLQTRDLNDHMGFRMPKTMQWQEDWSRFAFAAKSANGNGLWLDRWSYSRSGDTAGGNISGQEAGASGGGGGAADSRTSNLLLATNFGGAFAAAEDAIQTSAAPVVVDDDLSLAMQIDVQGNANGSLSANQDTAIGVITGSVLGSTGTFSSLGLFGAAFYRIGSSNNWQIYIKGTGAGAPTITDSGVVVSGRQRLRIEYHGANNSDDSVHRVIFKINGVIPTGGNLSLDLAGAGGAGPAVLRPVFRHRGTNHNDWTMLGVLDFAAAYWAGNIQDA